MLIDSLLRLSNEQALTATAASTNTIDLGTDKRIGADGRHHLGGHGRRLHDRR